MASREWWSRENRLLLLTLVVSAGALVMLAQFRFPEEQRFEPPPQPLERLAARATYDELASIVARLEQRIAPSLVILRVGTSGHAQPRSLQSVIERRSEEPWAPLFVPALRVRPDIAVARLEPDARVEGVLGHADAVPLLLASDPLRQIAVVRVPPPAAGTDWTWQSADMLTTPRYVVAVEGSRGGAMPRPIFLGRADRIEEPRWSTPLLVLARTPVAADGSFIFSLEGQLVGLAVSESGLLAIVPGTTLRAAAIELLETGSPQILDFGLTLAPLTGERVREYGVTTGVIVAAVAETSLARTLLRAGDLIQAVNGRPAVHPDAVLLQLAQLPPDSVARFRIRRGEEVVLVDVPVTEPPQLQLSRTPARRRP